MTDGDTVKMKLTFPRGTQKPGDLIEVPADEVHRWKGFAKPVDTPKPSGQSTTPNAAASDKTTKPPAKA
ncbi:hypothetical protein TPA0906_66840 [Streptomyces olivaceus]|uniref:hypothetical protein n=1 Tax=Streptomyces olivaceus TaxID=47716 RepID=UPI0022ED61FA|nr:hypothetical protein [Streptomyces olivaceus]GHJ04819.1 hypothetical protein TPA0906_66840 [Streptomyces olivaceus]